MINVLFVCHGNICRSPMAEFLFKDFVDKKGLSDLFHIESCATSREEIGNGVHYGTRRILDSYHIDCSSKRARQMTREDYNKFDYIIYMDSYNRYNMDRFVGDDEQNKCHLFLEYAGLHRDISDPWYTGNFIETRDDILLGINAFYKYLVENKKL